MIILRALVFVGQSQRKQMCVHITVRLIVTNTAFLVKSEEQEQNEEPKQTSSQRKAWGAAGYIQEPVCKYHERL